MGIGMSNEIDSRMAAQTLMWAYGAAIQDENENVIINSPETIAAVEYMSELYKTAMTPEVFGWNAASNNQLLVAGRASYILNSISAYRTAQKDQPETGADIFFRTPLVGPAGERRAGARARRLHLDDPQPRPEPRHRQGVPLPPGRQLHRRLRAERALQLPGLALDTCRISKGWLDNDPYGSEPADKLSLLKTANDWTTNLGHPGPANAAMGEIFALPTLPNMMARAATGQQTPEESVAEAEAEINAIFEKWRAEGLMGGGS